MKNLPFDGPSLICFPQLIKHHPPPSLGGFNSEKYTPLLLYEVFRIREHNRSFLGS